MSFTFVQKQAREQGSGRINARTATKNESESVLPIEMGVIIILSLNGVRKYMIRLHRGKQKRNVSDGRNQTHG